MYVYGCRYLSAQRKGHLQQQLKEKEVHVAQYCIARKFGRELSLVVWQPTLNNSYLNSN